MAGMMENIKGKMSSKMSSSNEETRDRYEDLKSRAKSGELSDAGKAELEKLRPMFEHRDSQ